MMNDAIPTGIARQIRARVLMEKTCPSACLFIPVLFTCDVMSSRDCLVVLKYCTFTFLRLLHRFFSCGSPVNMVAELSPENKGRVVVWPHSFIFSIFCAM